MKKYLFILSFLLSSISLLAQNFEPFTWQYPRYGAHAINCTRWIANQKFIAVGDAGTILLSSDAGVSWQRIEPFTEKTFRSIFIKDSLTLFAIASYDNGLGELFKTLDGGNTWTLIYNAPTASFRDIYFPNDSVGYIVGATSKAFKTTDGGVTWIDINGTLNMSGTLTSVYFLNADTGFVGRTATNAAMYKTENGGATWSQVFGYSGQACYTIKFLNDTLGYAGAYNSRIFRTTNAGATWSQQTTFQTNEKVTSIDFSDLTHGIAVTNSYVYRTSNGTTWTGPFIAGNNFISAAFSPLGNILLGDAYGGLHIASNSATTYTNSNPQKGLQTYRRIKFVDAQNGWAIGDGYNVLKTSDAGLTWNITNTSTYIDYVTDAAAISANKLIITNGNGVGKVYTTTNGGVSFTEQTLNATTSLNAISFPNTTHGYIVGNDGLAFKTTNGGTSYTAINTGITNNITEVFFVTPQLGFIVSEWGEIKKTIDNGNTWSSLNVSGMGTTTQIYFQDIVIGYTVNNAGQVFKTIDGGNNFVAAGTTCLQTPFDMQFLNDSTGFVVGSFVNASCDVSYTTNSGQTWQSLNFPYAYAGWGVYAFDTANVYIVGQNQSIIKSGVGTVTSNHKSISLEDNRFKIYPNPSKGIFQIEQVNGIANATKKLEVYASSGNLILTETINSKSTQLDLSRFSNGLYYVILSDKDTFSTFKISKQ